jgi:hypothetical protein
MSELQILGILLGIVLTTVIASNLWLALKTRAGLQRDNWKPE